jgi:hypothetical protein
MLELVQNKLLDGNGYPGKCLGDLVIKRELLKP